MVLESFITPEKAERNPLELFFIGIFYSSIAVLLSLWIFKEHSSLVMVFLTVFAAIPLLYNTMKREEKIDIKLESEENRIKEHIHVLVFLLFLFLGFVVGYSLWYIFLPTQTTELTFKTQMQTINSINAQVISGNFIEKTMILENIFLNNIKVLLFCIFFAFFFGAGAIFILTWNASVISAAIGNIVRTNIAVYAKSFGLEVIWAYFSIFSVGFLRYMTHGIFEILAYFIGGLAGSVISVAMINHDFATDRFKRVMIDSLFLFIIAIFILGVAALIEVFLTPSLF